MKIRKYIKATLFVGFIAIISACSEMDDYKDFIENGEITYTGKMDSLKVYSGKNRVKLTGIIASDPKVTQYRVFWNNNKDSISIPVERSNEADTLSSIIENLSENIYNFEIRTYDNAGNSSIPVYGTGEVFGDRYQNSLNQRPIVSNELFGSTLAINYASMDLTTGVIGTEIVYTNTENEEDTRFISIDSTNYNINNFQSETSFKHRTVFRPTESAIDSFYTEVERYTPQLQLTEPPYFKNSVAPFVALEQGDRWGTPAEWIHNEAALSHGGYGAMDGDLFSLESGWGQPDIINGKVYQTMVLEPGTYYYSINIAETNYEGENNNLDQAYITAATGNTLPDVTNVEISSATLGFNRIDNTKGMTQGFVFIVEEVSQVSIGIQTTNDQGAGRFLKINRFNLDQVAQPPFLKNNSFPFEAMESGDRWGTPAGWTHNEAALSHGGYGAMDGDIFNLESGWGQPDIINGKVYQTLVLEPGAYTYEIEIAETNYEGDGNDLDLGYFTVAIGDNLPDIQEVETSGNTLGFQMIKNNDLNPKVEFTLTELTKVSIGVQTTNDQGGGRYLKINNFYIKQN